MNICTITCQNADNHGARLQAYALAEYLRQQGHEPQVIDYRPAYMTYRGKMWWWPGRSLRDWGKLLLQVDERRRDLQRHHAFVDFSNRYIPLTPYIYNSVADLQAHAPEAELYICGSDQIWNTTFPNGTDPAYYLDFGKAKTRRISYAASFATDALVAGTEQFVSEHLARLDAISVRERSALSILEGLHLQGTHVLDPVFLLSSRYWTEMAERWVGEHGMAATIEGKRYILVHDFMRDPTIKAVAKRLARLTGAEIWQVSPRPLHYGKRFFRTTGPEQFLWLIRHAACVVSNSFHVTAFSLLFQRDVFVVNRGDGLNNRMADVLQRFGIAHRLVDTTTPDALLLQHIDYAHVTAEIDRQATASKQWLDAQTTEQTKRREPALKGQHISAQGKEGA